MSLLEELIDGASCDTVPVATLLRKAKVLAVRLQTGQLGEWVEYELVGYPSEVTLPEYRGPFRTEVRGHFGGPFGSGLQNAPIPSIGFPQNFREGSLFNIEFREAIVELERLAKSTSVLRAEWPADAVAMTNSLIESGEVQLYEGLGLQQAWRAVSATQLTSIVDTVRTRILDLALSLEQVAPDAGQPGADIPPSEKVHQVVTNVFGGTPNIAIASSDVDQTISLPSAGDEEGLLAYLSQLGIVTEDLERLRVALAEDAADETSGEEPGPRVNEWLGRVLTRSSKMAGKVGIGTATALATQAVSAYFGLQ